MGVPAFIYGILLSYKDPPFNATGILALFIVICVGFGFAFFSSKIVGFLFRVISSPILKAYNHAPFDIELGLYTYYSSDQKSLVFEFKNEEIARDFEKLNDIKLENEKTKGSQKDRKD